MPIIAKGIRVTDDQGRVILRDIDLTIPDRSITLLVGRNGAGKSTLLEALSGLVHLASGYVMYDHEPLWENGKRLNAAVLRRFGVVFQYPEQQLFASTVRKEFAYSLRYLKLPEEEVARRSAAAMTAMGLPFSLGDESPHTLSGGQKRRLALATTISTGADWMLLDEPTAGLDASGISAFIDFLTAQRDRGCGLVVATHDLETLLPHADHVIVLANGSPAAELSRAEIWNGRGLRALQEAGMHIPADLWLTDRMSRAGLLTDSRWLSPDEAAEIIANARTAGPTAPCKDVQDGLACAGNHREQHNEYHNENRNECRSEHHGEYHDERHNNHIEDHYENHNEVRDEIRGENRHAGLAVHHALQQLDPRAKWLFYMLLSIGILIQSSWIGFSAGALIALAIIVCARVPWRPLLTVTIPLFLFILLSMLISGIKVEQGVQLDLSASERTIFELLKILIVSMFGLSLAAVTSQLVMKHAIEHSLRGLSKFRLPVEAIALGCSLMLRFITLFLHEYRRFGKIVKARAKDRSKRNGIRFRHLHALFIPMIISLLQTASDLTTAMEARGMKSLKMRRTSGIRLQMVRRDWMVVLSGLLVFMMLAGMRYLL